MNAATRSPKGRPVKVEFREISGPTPERLQKTGGFFVIGDDQQGGKVFTIKDTPLDRMFSRDAIGGSEYAALQKYKHHWHHAGLEASIGSLDLDRVFSSDPGSMSGMAKTERQAHHRKQYREARDVLGHKTGIVVDNVVCHENGLDVAGYSIGYNSPFRAREGATVRLRQAGSALAKHWGMR